LSQNISEKYPHERNKSQYITGTIKRTIVPGKANMRSILVLGMGVLLGGAVTVNAAVGIEASAAEDTVLKVTYTGGTPNGSVPGVVVLGKKVAFEAIANNSGSSRAVIGRVAGTNFVNGSSGYQLGVLGVAADEGDVIGGVVGQGLIGVQGFGVEVGVIGSAASGNGVTGYGATGVYGSGTSLAGYFDGDVVITGDCSGCTVSDEKLKKNVQPLSGGLTKILAIQPKTYEMKVDEYKGRISLGKGGKKFGVLAQDLEKVLPEAVHPVRVPAYLTPAERKQNVKKAPLDLKAVSYTDLIPILIGAVQEQQALILALQAQVQQLQAR
jgi:hypothetical protein